MRKTAAIAGLAAAFGLAQSAQAQHGVAPPGTPVAFISGTAGVGPLMDPVQDLGFKRDYDANSWFAVGRLQAGGQTISYLFHVLVFGSGGSGAVVATAASITNETTGRYVSKEAIIPLAATQVGADRLSIKTPLGSIEGDYTALAVSAAIPGGDALNLTLRAESPVLYNGGPGIFPLFGMQIHEYSVPRLATEGTLTTNGKTYKVKGVSWFDRQWQNNPPRPAGAGPGGFEMIKWTWMELDLSNGDAISLWSALDPVLGKDRAWATILHADGSQSVVPIEPVARGAKDYWHSPDSGNLYPTRWTVRIPEHHAVLDVVPRPRHQEVASKIGGLSRYEGASTVRGVYDGKPVTGHAVVEMVGGWRPQAQQTASAAP